jgi:hypothetical protein
MIKYFCDRCGKEVTPSCDGMRAMADGHTTYILCKDCFTKFKSLTAYMDIDSITDTGKFCTMSDNDIDLLRWTFKVGDKVITADGREGIITHICTCDKCKERGFYEPTVTMDDGDVIYIMNCEKECGFEEYYQIGNHVFGNLDDKSIIEETADLMRRLQCLQKQYKVVEALKNKEKKIMGCNYYFFTKNKKAAQKYAPYSYSLVDTPDFGYEIHVGKCSGGWLPIFEAHQDGIRSIKEYKEAYDTGEFKIYDEYLREYDWDKFVEDVLKHNGGVAGAIPREYVERDKYGLFYDKDMPDWRPVSHFDYGHGKYNYMYFKDSEGYEFTEGDFS